MQIRTTPTKVKVMKIAGIIVEMTKAKEEILVVSKAMMMMRIRTEGPSLHQI